jgi:Transcriptional regulator, AbiEi antitoxin, Type IV TA system
VLSLQKMYDFEVVVGGYTAIEMQGYSHYIPLNKERQVHLFSKKLLPEWIEGLIEGVNFILHLQSELQSRKHLQNEFSSVLSDNTISFPWREEMPQIKMSNPERAILELFADVPEKVSFENVEQILQGMTSLSPNKLNELLLVCDNIRVRRLFLWMAERQNHPWFKKLNLERISLGSGNRVLVKGGVLNKKYKITVPQEYE